MQNCKHCGGPIIRRANEDLYRFRARVFCGRACSDPGRRPMTREEAIERLEAYSIPEPMSGCWIWTASLTRGYGQFTLYGKQMRANRAAYMLFHGEIPPGSVVRHKCDTPLCVNPGHLELGTPKQNSEDALTRGRFRVGPDHQNAKLSEADVAAIRADARKQVEIAAAYGVSKGTVSRVKNGHSYKNQNGQCENFAERRQPPKEEQ